MIRRKYWPPFSTPVAREKVTLEFFALLNILVSTELVFGEMVCFFVQRNSSLLGQMRRLCAETDIERHTGLDVSGHWSVVLLFYRHLAAPWCLILVVSCGIDVVSFPLAYLQKKKKKVNDKANLKTSSLYIYLQTSQ
jgi:hypothetical protein